MKKHSRYTPCLQTRQRHSVPAVLRNLVGSPWRNLILRWNWKAALLSSIFRANIFFAANLTAGWKAAGAAMTSEFVFRACTSGFYGAITQGLGEADPAWAAGLTVMFLVPLISHSLEPMPIRRLETVFDILRDYPACVGRVHWTDRAFYYALDGSIRPLRCALEGQNPPLVNMFLALLRTMRHPRLKSALRLALAERQELTL